MQAHLVQVLHLEVQHQVLEVHLPLEVHLLLEVHQHLEHRRPSELHRPLERHLPLAVPLLLEGHLVLAVAVHFPVLLAVQVAQVQRLDQVMLILDLLQSMWLCFEFH